MSKILIIEDDQILLSMYRKKFESEGFTVVTAMNGEEGLATMLQAAPNVILMDMVMPRLTGWEILDRMKADAGLSGIPVVAMSNLTNRDSHKMAIDKGAFAYLTKSENTPAQIVAKVKEALGSRSTPASA